MAQMPDNDFTDAEKQEFYEVWNRLSFRQKLRVKIFTAIFPLKDRFFLIFESLKNKFWIA